MKKKIMVLMLILAVIYIIAITAAIYINKQARKFPLPRSTTDRSAAAGIKPSAPDRKSAPVLQPETENNSLDKERGVFLR